MDSSLRDCGVQRGGVLAILGGLRGGMPAGSNLSLQIAYKREKEAKRRMARSSPFVALVDQMVEQERADVSAAKEKKSALAGGQENDAVDYSRREPVPPSEEGLLVSCLYQYSRLGWAIHLNVTSKVWWEAFITLNIAGVGVTTGLSLDGADEDDATAAAIEVVTNITFYVFIIEALLKIISYGPRPQHYFLAPDGKPRRSQTTTDIQVQPFLLHFH